MLPQGSRLITRTHTITRVLRSRDIASERGIIAFIITNRAKLLLEVRVSTCYQKKGRKRKNFTATYLPTLPERFPGRYLSYTAPDDRLHLNKKDTLVRSDANSLSLSFFYVVINGLGCLVGDFRRGTCPRRQRFEEGDMRRCVIY